MKLLSTKVRAIFLKETEKQMVNATTSKTPAKSNEIGSEEYFRIRNFSNFPSNGDSVHEMKT